MWVAEERAWGKEKRTSPLRKSDLKGREDTSGSWRGVQGLGGGVLVKMGAVSSSWVVGRMQDREQATRPGWQEQVRKGAA